MGTDESRRAWAAVAVVLVVIFGDLAAIVLMNTVGR